MLPAAPAVLFKPELSGTATLTYNPGTQEIKAGRLPWIQGQMRIHEFQVSLGYRIRTCLKNTNYHHHHKSYVSDLKTDLSHGTSLSVPLPTMAIRTKPLFNAFHQYRFSESHVIQGSLELGVYLTSAGLVDRYTHHTPFMNPELHAC